MMYQTTLAIVLGTVKYSENSLILQLFTRAHGRESYIVKGVHGRRAALPLSALHPLSIIEIETVRQAKREVQQIREGRQATVCGDILCNPVKNAISLFLAEVLSHCLREPHTDEPLFDFLHRSIVRLDRCTAGVANFHLVFLLELSRYLGFYPNVETAGEHLHFDLLNGSFTQAQPTHAYYLSPQWAAVIRRLMEMNFETMHQYAVSREQRAEILRQLIDYYRLHLSDFGRLKSPDVLQMLFD